MKKEYYNKEDIENIDEAKRLIRKSFIWDDSEKGGDYWYDVVENLSVMQNRIKKLLTEDEETKDKKESKEDEEFEKQLKRIEALLDRLEKLQLGKELKHFLIEK